MDEAPHRPSTSSQVSSVDFSTLKKINTNSSVSTAGSVSSKNPLTRLFIKNRSSSALDEDVLDDDRKGFLKMKRKHKNPKELSIQTDLLKEPAPASRKTTVNSPVSTLHNLFHRTTAINEHILEDTSRTTISLSSNNSNSIVADASFAQVYKFTDPNYAMEEDINDMEIHKKIFVPADQYIKSKLPAPAPATSAADGFSRDNYKFWSTLSNMTRPLFLPSGQKRLTNGSRVPLLTTTEEDIASYVDEVYVAKISGYDSESVEFSSIGSDLGNFFSRQLSLFSYDFEQADKSSEGDLIAREWHRISGKWSYFKRKILYFMLDCFGSLAAHGIPVETAVLNTFKTIIVVPFLRLRNQFSLDSKKEAHLLKTNRDLLSNLTQCFGMINTAQDYDADSADHKLFIDAVSWLTKL